jgi:hypothetical protein
MEAIRSQNVDDTFTTASFIVGIPDAIIDPVGDHGVGERFTISGSTNLAVGDSLMVEVSSSSFKPTIKGQSAEFSGASGVVTVGPGSGGLNRWSFDIDTSAFRPDEYIVRVSGISQDVTSTATFTLRENVPSPVLPVTTEPATLTLTTVPVTTPAPAPSPLPTTPKSPPCLIGTACALGLAFYTGTRGRK